MKLHILFLLLILSSCSIVKNDKNQKCPMLDIPLRCEKALEGSEIIRKLDTLELSSREELIVQEILSGNVPNFLRNFREVSFSRNGHNVTIYVLPDYLAIGSDSDFVRMPMTPMSAQIIADSSDCSLPTSLLVDQIAKASDGAIDPFPFRPLGDRNTEPITFQDSNNAINAIIKASGYNLGDMISGLKKDVILSNKLTDPKRTKHVTIYGWHYPNGTYIQPSTNIHLNWYVDYSHGIRLISNNIIIDGKQHKLQTILMDPKLFSLLSDEKEHMTRTRY